MYSAPSVIKGFLYYGVLCETVKDFVARVGKAYERMTENCEESEAMAGKCSVLREKLDSLLNTLNEESQATSVLSQSHLTLTSENGDEETQKLSPVVPPLPGHAQSFRPREQLMLRANSLKKAIRQIIEQAEKAVDEQNAQTTDYLLSFSSEDGKKQQNASSLAIVQSGNAMPRIRSSCRVAKPERMSSKTSLTAGASTSLPAPASNRDNLPVLNSKFLYSNMRAGMSGSLPESSVISRLLISADPFSSDPDNLECYTEKCVMNNYFGIGLDAKISLDFNNKRDEHPKKCRSRTKNMMWYGVLGTKELLQRTYKNLEQRVILECDGVTIPLPSLQGIAVLNIPSYAGGTNFWGGSKEDDVVAVFGSMQMAVSRVIKLQHHRIAQCRMVKITVLGDEGVPVQVDGEAWIQPPGFIRIVHKNRTQTLTRDRAFENTLKSWEDKQKCDILHPLISPTSSHPEVLSDEETAQVLTFGNSASSLINCIKEIAVTHHSMEQELAHAVNASSKSMEKVCKNSEGMTCSHVMEMITNVRALLNETELVLAGKMALLLDPPQKEKLLSSLSSTELELRRLSEIPWIWQTNEEEGALDFSKLRRSSRFRLVNKFKKEKNIRNKETRVSSTGPPAHLWGTEEVSLWLERLSLSEYKEVFTRHDIRGCELLHLERRDLKELGVTKVGHMKRILHGIRELSPPPINVD
ncbi:hypothetical protein GDO86_002529 [Hymenochirus boettgeri]|uniref:SAM domain-containing protein n=1 Tax=Hymenochirus boettgeri TaxID=247094 RepID=A0A8T2KIH2_9PIPI|nr:hypothetical protein GDO86_002529 [Hymenochirus boettgeri]